MFTHAIVKPPPETIIAGITSANMGVPDFDKALAQHQSYVEALQTCGLTVVSLETSAEFPDSCFIEDTALLTKRCAIVARLGAHSRQGEEVAVRDVLPEYFEHVESIEAPGTVEPGDVMMAGRHFYIGLSKRTNEKGAHQLIAILKKHGFSGSTIEMSEMLHLKTGLSYLENNTVVVAGEFVGHPEFANFNRIAIDPDEAYAANCVWVNGTVILPTGFPRARQKIEAAGYPVIPLDMSEFQKIDGGLSCLSLRF